MLKANGHIAVWWFLFVCYLPCLYWLVTVDSWRDIIFLRWFVRYLCETIKVTSKLAGRADPRDAERKMEMRRRQEGRGIVGWWRQKVGKADWKLGKECTKRWCFIHLKTSISPRAVSASACSNRLGVSWGLGHWIVLAISCISRHCNTLGCVDK